MKLLLDTNVLVAAFLSRDPDEDLVLSVAREGGCSCIVTGDAYLLELESGCGIDILTPAGFWRYEAKRR